MTVVRIVGGAVLGIVAGTLGTVTHRGHQPWGLVAALALVLFSTLTARSWASWSAWFGAVVGVVGAVMFLARTGPGGDVLVPTGELTSWIWLGGATLMALLVGALPRRWFVNPLDERPFGR